MIAFGNSAKDGNRLKWAQSSHQAALLTKISQ